jgi:beta-N-acetylhexosaminidase
MGVRLWLAALALAGWCVQAAVPEKLSPEAQAEAWLRSMNVREKAAQLILMPFYGENPVRRRDPLLAKYTALVEDLKIGGLILVNRVGRRGAQLADPVRSASFLNRMQKLAKVPLVVGGDFERGSSMRVSGVAKFPHAMAFAAAGDDAAMRRLGRITAEESRAMGVHWIYIPVADVNSNPDNPIINIRSFGEDPARVSRFVKASVEGAREAQPGVLTSVKHFPGHGDTATDSHYGLPSIPATAQRLEQVELTPFRAAIGAGVSSVMIAHVSVPAVEPRNLPSSVSRAVVQGLLREKLRFQGLVVTDAMDMKGLSAQFPGGESSVRALEAGIDVLLMPPDADDAVNAIEAAVRTGRLTEARLDASVRKVLRAKAELGLAAEQYVNPARIRGKLDTAAHRADALMVARKAVTVLKTPGSLVGSPAKEACSFALVDRARTETGDAWVAESRKRGLKAFEVDPNLTSKRMQVLLKAAEGCKALVVAGYLTFGRGGSNLPGTHPEFLAKLQDAGKPLTVVAMGSPYLLRHFPEAHALVATFSTVPASERAAIEALFGEIPVSGRTPVSIPGIAALGGGVTVEARPTMKPKAAPKRRNPNARAYLARPLNVPAASR